MIVVRNVKVVVVLELVLHVSYVQILEHNQMGNVNVETLGILVARVYNVVVVS